VWDVSGDMWCGPVA